MIRVTFKRNNTGIKMFLELILFVFVHFLFSENVVLFQNYQVQNKWNSTLTFFNSYTFSRNILLKYVLLKQNLKIFLIKIFKIFQFFSA